MAYETVNSAWPAGTRDGRDLKPTPQEAIEAARRLYRFAFGKSFKGEYRITSGRNYTYPRWGIFRVNPDQSGGGWHEIVHSMSHYAVSRLYPEAKGHGHQHAFMERQMIEHVITNGWLDGALRKATRAATPKPDSKVIKLERVRAAEKRWTTKLRRAQTALKKLARDRRRYERQLAA